MGGIAGDDQNGDGRIPVLDVQGHMPAVHTMTVSRRFDVACSERPLNHVQQLKELERLVQEGDVT